MVLDQQTEFRHLEFARKPRSTSVEHKRMALRVRPDAIFCLDFTRPIAYEFNPYEVTIPEVIYRKCDTDRIAFIFDAEKVCYTFGKVKSEMEQLAAGLLSTGLQPNDRILICGYNHSQVLISVLAAARAGLVFSLSSPNFGNADQLRHKLQLGEFRALVMFGLPGGGGSDRMFDYMMEFCPELKQSPKGKLKSASVPKLTHVIQADEDHLHAGTYTLSEIFGKGSKERIEKLPDYRKWNSHKIAAIQFTLGISAPPKAVGLTHYQLINGCRIAANAIGIKHDSVLVCALPMFRIPVLCLYAFTPFLTESRSVISEPWPFPQYLFATIKKYQCTSLVSNAVALKLLLKMAQVKKVFLPSMDTVILLGEKVASELLISIERVMKNARRIAVGMLLTETGAIPVLSDNTTNLVKAIGRPLDGFEVDLVPVDKLQAHGGIKKVGELRVKALEKTKFVGYGPKYNTFTEWIPTGDVATVTKDGNIEIIAHKDDLMYDKKDVLVEHWRMEKAMSMYDQIKGVQVVQVCHGAPIVAVIVPKSYPKYSPEFLKTDLSAMCRSKNVYVPDQFAIIDDFPRINTKIQKYKLREMLKNKKLPMF